MKDLDYALDVWRVEPQVERDDPSSVLGWYPVSNESGIVAYFGSEAAACRFRLVEVNRTLNG